MPATTCAFVTTYPSAATKPEPSWITSQAGPITWRVLDAAASAAARASSWLGGRTGSAGRGGMPENTSGNPNRLNRRRTWASNDGGCGRAASSVCTTADPRISVATAGNGPFARFSARNQIASSDATTATAEPATESAFPNLDAARLRA
jgi:hypothetical protein